MNGDFIDILELIIESNLVNRNRLCLSIAKLKIKCNSIMCTTCVLNTSKIHISDYRIQIIKIKGMLNEQ